MIQWRFVLKDTKGVHKDYAYTAVQEYERRSRDRFASSVFNDIFPGVGALQDSSALMLRLLDERLEHERRVTHGLALKLRRTVRKELADIREQIELGRPARFVGMFAQAEGRTIGDLFRFYGVRRRNSVGSDQLTVVLMYEY